MRRWYGSWAVLAVLLAVLLPARQAQCLWMPFAAQVSGAGDCGSSGATDHACCRPPAQAPTPGSQGATHSCPCIQLPTANLPADISAPPVASPVLVVVPLASLASPPQVITAPPPAPDVGSPPLPAAREAHAVRAPPLT
jgi:hypothetical protein